MEASAHPKGLKENLEDAVESGKDLTHVLDDHQPSEAEIAQAKADIDTLEPAVLSVVKESKAGYKTTEFWVTLLGVFLTQVGALHLPGKYGATITTVALLAAYALSRGIAKNGVPHVEPDEVV